jgi:hypothetical protein
MPPLAGDPGETAMSETPKATCIRCAGAALALALAGLAPALAEPIYKSVDAQGNVTYSSIPPADAAGNRVEQIEIRSGPSESQLEDAHARESDRESSTQAETNERDASGALQAAALAKAQEELIAARAELERAKVPGDDDWQHLAKGGKVLKQGYRDDVAAAEARVQAAEQALRQARKGP